MVSSECAFNLKNVWQAKDFKSFVFVSVAGKGLTGANFVCVAREGLTGFLVLGERLVGWGEADRRRLADHQRIVSQQVRGGQSKSYDKIRADRTGAAEVGSNQTGHES